MRPKNRHAVALGRKGGSACTPAQLAARRANARKGGRPVQALAGIVRRGAGWQASVRVGGRLYTQQFPATTSLTTLVEWRAMMRTREQS